MQVDLSQYDEEPMCFEDSVGKSSKWFCKQLALRILWLCGILLDN